MDAFLKNNTTGNNLKGSVLVVDYTFPHSIDKVWEKVKNYGEFMRVTGLFSNFRALEKDFGTKGCVFVCDYNNFFNLKYKITEVVEEKFFKKIVYISLSSNSISYQYQIDFCLYKKSSNNACYLTYKIEFLNRVITADEMLLELKYEKLEIFRKISKILYRERVKKIYEQTESCIISKNRLPVWELVKKFDTKFCEIVKEVADEVIIDDNQLKLDSKVTFNYQKPKFSISFFVTEVEEEQDQTTWMIKMSSNNNFQNYIKIDSKVIKEEEEYYTPEQEILFELRHIDESKSILIFKHLFKQRVNIEKLQILSENKLRMLERFKVFCESTLETLEI